MSYRRCNSCKYIINNRIYDGDECPNCDSTEMISPLDEGINWDDLYGLQHENRILKGLLKHYLNIHEKQVENPDGYLYKRAKKIVD